MNRRVFLAGAAATLSSHAVGTARRVIDTHTHFYDPKRPKGVPWPPRNDEVLYRTVLPAEFAHLTKPFGVTGTVVVEASPWLEDNDWILKLAEDNPIITALIGNLPLGTMEFAPHFARLGRNPLFRGIRLGGKAFADHEGDQSFLDDLRRLGDGGMTVDALGGPDMLVRLARLADAVPNLKMVIDHVPFEPFSDGPAQVLYDEGLKQAGQRGNIYAKVSNVLRRDGGRLETDLDRYRPCLDKLWAAFGPDRVIYGSNWPVSDHTASYAEVYRVVAAYVAEKGNDAADKYFWRNSLSAYGWVRRQQPL